jgi:hypothetical protein
MDAHLRIFSGLPGPRLDLFFDSERKNIVCSRLDPVQITIPDNSPATAHLTVDNLRGGGGSSYFAACIFCIIALLALGLLVGSIVGFAIGNKTVGIVCASLFVVCCCGSGGGGAAAAKKR